MLPPALVSVYREYKKDTNSIASWPIYEVKKLIAGSDAKALESVKATKKHRLLRRSPIVAGLALYHHRTEVHELAVALTNAWGSIILPAHLYNAATDAGYSDCFWTDMERLFALHGEEQFFVGGQPDNTADYVTRFMLQIGVSASVLTNRRRRSKKLDIDDFSRRGTRFLKPRTPIHDSLRDRYQKNMSRMNWSPESIEEILSRAQMQQESKASRGASSRLKNKGPGAATAVRISPTELLGHLGDAMQSEVQELAFPYLYMHITNWAFLKGMHRGYDPVLRTFFGSTYMQHEWQLPLIIGHILALADGVEGGDEAVLEMAGVMLDKMEQVKAVSLATSQMYRLSGRENEVSQKQLASMSLDWMPDEDEEDVSEFDDG